MSVLRAIKAAEFQGGMDAHAWMYDRLERAHLVETRDVVDSQTLLASAVEIGLDLPRFEADFNSDSTFQAILED